MILVDTSIWVDHLRSKNPVPADLLYRGQVLTHSFIIGEIALGSLKQRALVLSTLGNLPRAESAIDAEVFDFIELHKLFSLGIGFIDVHLLATTRLTQGAKLWSRDKRLCIAADQLGLAAYPAV